MERHAVLDDLTQFQSYVKQIDLTFNQYLLDGEHSLLIHTGDIQLAGQLIEEVFSTMQGRPISFIFVSHFESDECGALRLWLDKFPEAKVLCSEVTARQLVGFDITTNAIIKKPGEDMTTSGFELEFIAYPAEMHLWEGLLAFERRRRVLFSSDLFGRRGPAVQTIVPMGWEEEAQKITPTQIPSPDARSAVQASLWNLPVRLVAPGHGPILKMDSQTRG